MGLTPSEKKRYNESKRRRRQALESYETGKIKPIRSKGKTAAVIIAVLIVISAVSAVIISRAVLNGGQSSAQKSAVIPDSSELLRIVSARYPAEKDEVPQLSDFNSFKVNSIMLSDLEKLFEAAGKKGIELKINSAYISYDGQSKLFEKKLSEVNKDGKYSQVRASAIASASVSKPGESEAQIGMLIDFDVSNSKTRAFLEREGINFGFILRYPEDKTDLTHHDYSASVYRYVGAEYAGKMRTLNMCLEEFADYTEVN